MDSDNFSPYADSSYDLGTSSLYFRAAYIDAITTTGNVTVGGDLTVNGTTTTVNQTESRNENDVQLKAMEMIDHLSKIQADNEGKDQREALNALMKLLDVSVASDTEQARKFFSDEGGN